MGRGRQLDEAPYRAHVAWLAGGGKGTRLELTGDVLEELRADSLDLRKIQLARCKVAGASFEYSQLDEASFVECDLSGAVLGRGSMKKASIEGGRMTKADLRLGNFGGSRWSNVDATGADLQRARLDGVVATGVNFAGASMVDVVLDGSRWTDCDFRGARLVRAKKSLDLGHGYDVVFERCDFRGSEWTDFRLRAVRFVDCRFYNASGAPEFEGPWTAEGTDGSQSGDGSVPWNKAELEAQLRGGGDANPNSDLVERGRRVMQQAMQTLNDPSADARIEAREQKKGRRQELLLLGARPLEGKPYKEVHIADLIELGHYLTMRKAKVLDERRVEFKLDRRAGAPSVTATWVDGEVRFASGDRSESVPLDSDGSLSNRGVEEALAKLA